MQQFEDDESQKLPDDGGEPRRQEFPIRASGIYSTVDNPWPRDAEKETRDIAGAAKRKPYPHRRQGNRWDQYGESSSAASSEAHIASDHVHSESTWGPYESAHRDKRAAQPYRLQKANRGEGQWSRWASDIRQSQLDHWSESSMWQSPASDDSSWKRVSEWEGSQWSAPTGRTLKGSDYESDRDWHLKNMRYGEGWACDSTQSHRKRAKPTDTDPEDDRMTDSSVAILDQRQRRMTQKRMAVSGGKVTEVRIGLIPLIRRDNGDHNCGTRGTDPVLLEILQRRVPQCIISTAYTKVIATP